LKDRLQSTFLEIKDIVEEIESISEKIEHDPVKIEEVNDRLHVIYNLQQKHNVASVAELVVLKDDFEQKITRAVGFGDEIKKLQSEIQRVGNKLKKLASELTEARKKSFPAIEKAIVQDLIQLGMEKAKLRVVYEELAEFTSSGKDLISFLFSANADSEPAEISKIASGGEMSRLMLAIKNLLRQSKKLPTIIFDEIDTGVSGEVANKMGNILKTFSVSTQIINITHLPQIAAKGDTHFVVFKYELEGKTFTSVRNVEKDERVEELAKMVSGNEITDNTLKTARELLKN
jgi:DNA repair protein RecN (Recombination protein N)